MSEKTNRKRMQRDELGSCSRCKNNPFVLKLGRRALLRSKEVFFVGLAKGCTITADWTKDRESLNVTSGSAVPPLTKICRGTASLIIGPEM